jgi:hypothetical protein
VSRIGPNRHLHNNRRAAGSSVLYVVCVEAIYNEDQLPLELDGVETKAFRNFTKLYSLLKTD